VLMRSEAGLNCTGTQRKAPNNISGINSVIKTLILTLTNSTSTITVLSFDELFDP